MIYSQLGSSVFDSLPLITTPKAVKKNCSDFKPISTTDLETDVEIEEEYLEYLFHLKKSISHLVNW